VKLLLDEMLPAALAEALRERGVDVSAVQERPELRGLADPDVFAVAQREGRAIVTYNREDFFALDRQYRDEGRDHHDVVIVHPRRFPQGAVTLAHLITAIALFHGAPPAYPAFVHWLQAPSQRQ
jgi:hypothetical protein